MTRESRGVRTVVFSGGRGSGALVERLLAEPRITLTLAINGYDDGASTGEVRRFLGDALGPSDFRKNAGRAARALRTAPDALIELLDWRLPDPCPPDDAARLLATLAQPGLAVAGPLGALVRQLEARAVDRLAGALAAFEAERAATGRAFAFADCALGNLVFAGLFLSAGRAFNEAVAAYGDLLGLPPGLIVNVTDGANAHLAALDAGGALLATEAAIVDARRTNRVQGIYLLDREPPAPLAAAPRAAIDGWLAGHAVTPRLNPALAARLAEADLIVFAPGTQHSSLFPSYLTDGLAEAIVGNQHALKLLVTNLQPDAETPGASAVDIVERALHYLRRRGDLDVPAPCLITHSLINEPRRVASGAAYVAPGAVDRLVDPRHPWIHDFEAGATGQHDGPKVLDPFLDALLRALDRPRVALLLDNTLAADSVIETALELVRGGIEAVPIALRVFHGAAAAIDERTRAALPFPLVALPGSDVHRAFADAADAWPAGYVASFDSSGMYWGEDLVRLLAQVPLGAPAAIWGSRRLSVRDVHASYRLRYRRRVWLGVVSYVGSHVLSLLYLLLYGRYVSDTLSGVWIVARPYARDKAWPPADPQAPQVLLSAVLRDQAELRELPVRFQPLPARRARRLRITDGLAAIGVILSRRWRRPAPVPPAVQPARPLPGPAA